MSTLITFEALLQGKACLVLDGALATELQSRGCNIDGALWSARALYESPDLVRQVHLDYFRAGTDIAITASYQASVPGLQKIGYSATQAIELMKKSVTLAQQAKERFQQESPNRHVLIAGSIGPYGAYLADGSEYTGDYNLSPDEMKNFHRPRMQALLDAGVDLLAIETLPSFPELEALLSLLSEFPSATAYLSFTIQDDSHISDGTAFSAVVEKLNDAPQVVAIGVNCVPEGKVTGALRTLSTLTKKPLLAYPNSGQQYDVRSNSWTGENAFRKDLAEKIKTWRSLGAKIIGGCCQTSPQDIHIVASCLRSTLDNGK
jgi:homocysteine S-methyltransferase